jgi:hypothetical protein
MMLAWRRGLTRLYLVLWSLWVLFLLVVGPAYVSHHARERANAAEVEYRAHATAGNAIEAADALRRLVENKRTTLVSIYRDMSHTWPDVLVPLIGFPLAFYGALYGTALLIACVLHGVRPASRRGPGPAPTRTQPGAFNSARLGTAPKPAAWPKA